METVERDIVRPRCSADDLAGQVRCELTMDGERASRISWIGHESLSILVPLDSARLDRFVERLEVRRGAYVIDVGCGKGEWLVRIAQRHGARGLGIDRSAWFVQAARERATRANLEESVTFSCADAEASMLDEGSCDLALCIGASSAFGGYRGALERLAALVRPKASFAIGETYWMRDVEPAYAQTLGIDPSEGYSFEGLFSEAEALGLVAEYAFTSTTAEWDDYEWSYRQNLERYADLHPADPDAAEIMERAELGRRNYVRWQRDTMGFAVLLLRKEAPRV